MSRFYNCQVKYFGRLMRSKHVNGDGKLLCLSVGSKAIGMSLSDRSMQWKSFGVLHRTTLPENYEFQSRRAAHMMGSTQFKAPVKVAEELNKILVEENVVGLVLGTPRLRLGYLTKNLEGWNSIDDLAEKLSNVDVVDSYKIVRDFMYELQATNVIPEVKFVQVLEEGTCVKAREDVAKHLVSIGELAEGQNPSRKLRGTYFYRELQKSFAACRIQEKFYTEVCQPEGEAEVEAEGQVFGEGVEFFDVSKY